VVTLNDLSRFAGSVAAILVAAFIVGAAPGGSHAKTTNSTLKIDATAVASLTYKILSNPKTIEITRSDLKKGFEIVPGGTMISVSTNNPCGYTISMQAANVKFFSSVRVTTKQGRTVSIAHGKSAEIHIPGPINGTDIQGLSYRFHLSNGEKPGSYPWPIAISVHM
jgi:hypothetical protein